MLAGIVLFIVAALFLALGALLPRLGKRLEEAFGGIPQGMQQIASGMVPGLDVGMRVMRMIPWISRGCLVVGIAFLTIGVFALTSKQTPLLINVLAGFSGVCLLALIIGLLILAKQYGPSLRQMTSLQKRMRL